MEIKKILNNADVFLNSRIAAVFAAVLLISTSSGYVIMEFAGKNLDKLSANIEEAKRVSNLEITVLKDPQCFDCFDVKPFIDAIKKQKVSVTSEKEIESTSEEGKTLITKYGIKKIPSVVITGEVERDQTLKDYFNKTGEIKDSVFVLKNIGNPYVAADTGEYKGKVDIILLGDKSCKECFSSDNYVNAFKTQFKMAIENQDNVNVSSPEGKALVKNNGIEAVPTIIVTGDLESYPTLSQIGNIKNDIFTLKKVNAPYREIESGKVRGLVDAIIVTDKSCTECFDTANYASIFRNYGINFRKSVSMDIAEEAGKSAIKEYAISQVPTIIMTGDVAVYEALVGLWSKVGTVENRSAYVLREGVKQLGTYKDLSSGKVISPSSAN